MVLLRYYFFLKKNYRTVKVVDNGPSIIFTGSEAQVKVVQPTMEEMANFEDFLYRTEEQYNHLGAVKIRPPIEWLKKISVHSQETFNSKFVYPKIQNAHKLTEGIFRLTNNPLQEGDLKKRKKMTLKVIEF